ncbi:MAG: MarR family winged helix-turn-helix transcriptional regulator [Muribaculaceae bacterium]|nr:MarR family winged helix-turn-helix transcriptional regulator [Muribaculaceae bacterium]
MENRKTYDTPYVGCLVGTAFQKMTSQLEAVLKKNGIGITAGEYMILRALYSQDGLQQCEISEMVGKDKSSVCRSVSALTKKGLVDTESVSYKCVRVRLTEKAQKIRPEIFRIAEERHQALLATASAKDIEIFIKVLKAIVNQ